METRIYSYHIFYFPFKWEMKNRKNDLFEKKVSLENINPSYLSNWERNTSPENEKEETELYDEKNYFFEFVHNLLYDTGKKDSLMKHYERREPKISGHGVTYNIAVKEKLYVLCVEDISLNFYATGVGTLIFYLRNSDENQRTFSDIKKINQFGRRIMPPFFDDIGNRMEIANYISVEGLRNGIYREDFAGYEKHKTAWLPALFILQLIGDFSESLDVVPVIDDRMIVNCWYAKNELSNKVKEDLNGFKYGDDWYAYTFIDSGDASCQNLDLRRTIIDKSTNARWEKYGTVYGVSRFSLVVIGDEEWFFSSVIRKHMRTLYSRMLELVLAQQSSLLKFSEEVTKVSGLNDRNEHNVADHISSLYRQYIRFVNQVYFKQVTTQDQGIELYRMMQELFDIKDQIRDLDNEISELHGYYSMLIDGKRARNGEILNMIATIFLPATLIASVFGMNTDFGKDSGGFEMTFLREIVMIVLASVSLYFLFKHIIKK